MYVNHGSIVKANVASNATAADARGAVRSSGSATVHTSATANGKSTKTGRLNAVRPSATPNAVADAIGVGAERSLSDVVASVRVARERPLDLLSVAGQLAPFAGAGLDAQILEDYSSTCELIDKFHLGGLPDGLWRYGLAVATRSVPRAPPWAAKCHPFGVKKAPRGRGGPTAQAGRQEGAVNDPKEASLPALSSNS